MVVGTTIFAVNLLVTDNLGCLTVGMNFFFGTQAWFNEIYFDSEIFQIHAILLEILL
jgi:hypothetical protein